MLLQAGAAELTWLTDLPKAETQAKAENKMVLLDFTGSDWCGWCMKFDKEVFNTPEFKQYAAKNLVLVKVDFPRSKPQSAALKKANKALEQKYSVGGFPTLILLNKNGKKLGQQVGYSKGGPKVFIAKLKKFQKQG